MFLRHAHIWRRSFKNAAREEWDEQPVWKTLELDLRTRAQQAGSKGECEKEKVRCEVLSYQKESRLSEELSEVWCREAAAGGPGSCEIVEKQAMGIAPTERLLLEGRWKEWVSSSLFTEVTEFGGQGGSIQHGYAPVGGRRVGEQIGKEQQKSWRKRIFEAPTKRQVRGLAGAVMCETGDLGNQVATVALCWLRDRWRWT